MHEALMLGLRIVLSGYMCLKLSINQEERYEVIMALLILCTGSEKEPECCASGAAPKIPAGNSGRQRALSNHPGIGHLEPSLQIPLATRAAYCQRRMLAIYKIFFKVILIYATLCKFSLEIS